MNEASCHSQIAYFEKGRNSGQLTFQYVLEKYAVELHKGSTGSARRKISTMSIQ